MNLRYIVQTSDPGNELGNYSEPVTVFDDALAQLATDMAYTMKAENGVGLAAPQVGVNKRLFVIATDDGWQTYVNPVLLTHNGRLFGMYEGCLSCKGVPHGVVVRPSRITAVWQTVEGKRRVGDISGFRARVFLHELDHLNGSEYTARVKPGDFLLDGETPKELQMPIATNRKARRRARHAA